LDLSHAFALALPLSLFSLQSGIPPSQIHAISDAPGLSPAAAAADYEARLKALPPAVLPREEGKDGKTWPAFDLVLLGVGPDGHVASLFPGLGAVEDDSGAWVLGVGDSPKPPPERISLSLGAINAAAATAVVALGAGKAPIVGAALGGGGEEGSALLPVQRVRSAGGVTWVLDEGAAGEL
jgi:6-phosphogluconolactonase